MKSELVLRPPAAEEPSYPYIGICHIDGVIVLFSDKGKGTLLHRGVSTYAKIGDYDQHWNEAVFEKYHGQVILEN